MFSQADMITIEIPTSNPQGGGWTHSMEMSPLDSFNCDSPGFNNFMMTLSPIMQLSSPQPTMSPREGGNHAMSPIIENEEMPFAFINGMTDTANLIHTVDTYPMDENNENENSMNVASQKTNAPIIPKVKHREVHALSTIQPTNAPLIATSSPPAPNNGGSSNAGGKKCNCRKSRCLKLYCECFAAGFYCTDDCGCLDCNNTKSFENTRSKAIQSILARNPNAFVEKIQFVDTQMDEGENDPRGAAHIRGCHCRKSACLKKYCECFFAGVYCGDNCKCEGCKNFEGSEALENTRAMLKGQRMDGMSEGVTV